MSSRRGASLAEIIVYCFIFSMLLVVLMTTYVQSARSFHVLVRRQGIQSELRRISSLLRRDLTLTDYRSVGCADRTALDATAERDAVSFVGVDAWTEKANFDEYLKPRWNIYVLYYGTQDDSEKVAPPQDPTLGQLIRKELTQTIPYPIPLGPATLDGLASAPTSGDGYKLLTRNLVSFEVTTDQVEEFVRVHVVLRAEEGPTGSGLQRESEMIECYIDMRPENTWPPR